MSKTIASEVTALLSAAGILEPPVSVESIARQLGAQIRYEPADDEVSGMVWRAESGRAIIGVNSLHSKTRKRFTVAHEIGHLRLHVDEAFHVDEGYALRRDSTASLGIDRKEIEANHFAAALLMPEAFLLRDADVMRLRFDFESDHVLVRLAKRYEVSQQAMTIRLWELFRITA
ncbi:MAG TPA: ImmA/IrrE family metallo-endopeptidase [Thermoanaerobaculia bacterium]|nr:ImmA/IrrE family metallo-endopeptidase [Thermoanaerobaculia bacterium]